MDFTTALSRKLEEVKRPPNLPTGHYVWTVDKIPDMEEFESSKTGDTYTRITFQCACVSPHDDVDPDELAEFGNVAGARNRKVFLYNQNEEEKAAQERTLFQMKRFLEHCGVDEDLSLEEGLNDVVGKQFLGEIVHRPDPTDTEIIYAEIKNTAEV